MTLSLFADTSGPMEAVVHGRLSGVGGRHLPGSVAARGPPEKVSCKIYGFASLAKRDHFYQENHYVWNRGL